MPQYQSGFPTSGTSSLEGSRRNQVRQGFLPDEDKFSTALDAKIDEIMSQLPVGVESFNADLAARGIFSAGEAPAEMYRSVYAPVARAATSAVSNSMLAFNEATMRGNIQAESFRQAELDRNQRWDMFQAEMDAKPKWWQEVIGQVAGGAASALPFVLGGGGGGSSTPNRGRTYV